MTCRFRWRSYWIWQDAEAETGQAHDGFVYVNTRKSEPDHIKVFATADAAQDMVR